MAVKCKIIQIPDLRLCGDDGFINVFMAQPAVDARRDEESGYGPSPAQVPKVEALVDGCLGLVSQEGHEHNLIVFPEAMIPRTRIQRIRQFIDNCPNNTVVIAGIESLLVGSVVDDLEFPIEDDARDQLRNELTPEHRFINCCLTFVRDSTGASSTHFQAKMDASHAEQTLPGMFKGNNVLLFSSRQFSFMTMICSDLIQNPDGSRWLSQLVLDSAHKAWDASGAGTALTLDAIVNIQCNPKPNHHKFRKACQDTLGTRKETVRLSECQILLANWGGFWDGEEPIVSSAIMYQTNHWQPTSPRERNLPHVFSFTQDQITDHLNIVAFRSQGHGCYYYRMLPCVRANPNDPSKRYPVRDAVFHRGLGTDQHQREHKTAWHDRCERWLPNQVAKTGFPGFWATHEDARIGKTYHDTYGKARRQIIGKSPNNLKSDFLCLTLSNPETANPDLWGNDQRMGLAKWAALATLFCFEDATTDLTGSDWYCLKWRNHMCLAFIDGYNTARCRQSLELYYKAHGRLLPQDPEFADSLLLVLFRHMIDDREQNRIAAPIILPKWTKRGEVHRPPGVRPELFSESKEDIAKVETRQHAFWCTAEDFDVVREAESEEQLRTQLGDVCEPALG